MPTLFERFGEEMPKNEKLIGEALKSLEARLSDPESIKKNFSDLLDEAGKHMYAAFLENEKRIADKLLLEYFETKPASPFPELEDFFKSLFQSRKPRAGKAFEKILKDLFKRIGYPFDEQRVINGQPDFLMPSEEHYKRNAMDCIVFTVKRTLRERWRQIVTEGTKAYGFFLATIDDSVAVSQLEAMRQNKIYLVVPKSLKKVNPDYSAAANVLTFEEFFLRYLDPAIVRWKEQGAIK